MIMKTQKYHEEKYQKWLNSVVMIDFNQFDLTPSPNYKLVRLEHYDDSHTHYSLYDIREKKTIGKIASRYIESMIS